MQSLVHLVWSKFSSFIGTIYELMPLGLMIEPHGWWMKDKYFDIFVIMKHHSKPDFTAQNNLLQQLASCIVQLAHQNSSSCESQVGGCALEGTELWTTLPSVFCVFFM